MVGLYVSKRAIPEDEVKPFLKYVKSCRRLRVKTSGAILCCKKGHWSSCRELFIENS